MNHIVDTCPLTKYEGGLNLKRTMTTSHGWNLQRLQHSRKKQNVDWQKCGDVAKQRQFCLKLYRALGVAAYTTTH